MEQIALTSIESHTENLNAALQHHVTHYPLQTLQEIFAVVTCQCCNIAL